MFDTVSRHLIQKMARAKHQDWMKGGLPFPRGIPSLVDSQTITITGQHPGTCHYYVTVAARIDQWNGWGTQRILQRPAQVLDQVNTKFLVEGISISASVSSRQVKANEAIPIVHAY